MREVGYYKGSYNNWKAYADEYGIDGISKESSDWIKRYLYDLEEGKNVGKGRKGQRSFVRLQAYRHVLTRWAKLIEAKKIKSIIKVDSDTLHTIIKDIRNQYSSTTISDYGRAFKSFWHWYMRINRQKNKDIRDISEDLESAVPKTRFVYITKEQLDKNLIPFFSKYEYQLATKFIFDTILRAPKEFLNLKAKDVYEKNGGVWINIPDAIAKNGYGRTFNLLYTGDELLKHIKKNELKPDDYLFMSAKEYKTRYIPELKAIAKKNLGEKISHPKAQKLYSEIEPYDLRHSGAVHLRILASKNNSISLDAIRQRGGWQDFSMLNYYTEFIGLTGEINKESLLIEEDKTKLEKEINFLKKKQEKSDAVMSEIKKMAMGYQKQMMTLFKGKTPEQIEKYLKEIATKK